MRIILPKQCKILCMKVAIIGAGVTGLVAGYRLLQKGHQVTIFEKNERAGGLLAGFLVNGTYLEKAYHHIFKTDEAIIGLIGELGLEVQLKWHPEKTAIYCDYRMYPFNGPKDLLSFGALPMIDRLRTGLVGLWLQKDAAWRKYKKVSASTWMTQWNGKAAYEVMWEPLLRGKFHEYYDKVSMAWLWARIHTRANSKGQLGYLEGGFEQVVEKLEKKIVALGGQIKTKTLVEDIEALKKNYDKILLTGPIKGVNYLGAIEVVFTSKQSLSPYYWHNINDTKSPFLAFIQHTNLVDKKKYGNEHVYYMGTYVPHDHRLFKADDSLIKKEYFDYLKKIFPAFEKKSVKQSFVFKLANTQHIVTTDYVVPSYETNDKHIFQANFAQIFPEDRGTNFAVREGNKISELLCQK